ncbi:MAG: hypothetical protein B9J98_08135 [Candidatus Terraquivivens tikiterensis]|uniref:Uncharacterized protein n=1 Tax=Candidatus Terraquivivens tikiterensis TaxID=1980982 RepID=A0A2R7Y0Y7_9ARCH|nr:MAG: hypothetical protein B9J98_08135 [Candidatus Terraquivivens tikiterensis]
MEKKVIRVVKVPPEVYIAIRSFVDSSLKSKYRWNKPIIRNLNPVEFEFNKAPKWVLHVSSSQLRLDIPNTQYSILSYDDGIIILPDEIVLSYTDAIFDYVFHGNEKVVAIIPVGHIVNKFERYRQFVEEFEVKIIEETAEKKEEVLG